MPKNKGKGGKNRRRGKNENDIIKRELILKEPGQEYAQVTKMLGNGRLEAICMDGQKRLCHIRGKLRKKVWINGGDLILLGLRDFQDNKADVILRYLPEEGRQLKTMGHIPAHITISDTSGLDNKNPEKDSDLVVFDDDAEGASISSEASDQNNDESVNDMSSSEDETGLGGGGRRSVKFNKEIKTRIINLQDSSETESDEDIIPMYSKNKRRVYQPDEDY